jgi:hypothetical protein
VSGADVLVIVAMAIAGGVGGFVNSLFVNDMKLMKPRNTQRFWDLGFYGNLIVGALVGLATYELTADLHSAGRQITLAFLTGAGGGNALTSLLMSQQLTAMRLQLSGTGGVAKDMLGVSEPLATTEPQPPEVETPNDVPQS